MTGTARDEITQLSGEIRALALVTIAYLVAVYGVKRWFFARYRLN